MWAASGLVKGEHTYTIPVSELCSIQIRSSVHSNGRSAGTGQDSIRAWLVGTEGTPLGSKVQAYVTRTVGWHVRMVDMLRKLYLMGLTIKTCTRCGQVTQIYKVKKEGPTKGKLFIKCSCPGSFKWIEN